MNINIVITICLLISESEQYKILAIFPHNGRSHHIFYSTLAEELAVRDHEVTVVSHFPLKKLSSLKYISLEGSVDDSNKVNIKERFTNFPNIFINFYRAYKAIQAFKHMANINCKRLLANNEVRALLTSKTKYDLVIVEHFATDCGLAIAYKLNAPVVGMTAHVLMPWLYSRLGAANHPTYIQNHYFGIGSKPDLWNRIQSLLITLYLNMCYSWIIQSKDQETVNRVFPEVPSLESLGRNISLLMLNQYFPLTGSLFFGANVIEIGGMHIRQENQLMDEKLNAFLENAETDVVYISFGTVTSKFPDRVIKEIQNVISSHSNTAFVWKTDIFSDWTIPSNVYIRDWLPQVLILGHPKLKAFITHSGMLSTSEAIHCGVPIVSIPLFGDQFVNAASAVDNGLGVTVNIENFNESTLADALLTVLGGTYQKRAQRLSEIWKDRPLSPMNTAVYWIEYVAKYKGTIQMKLSTMDLSWCQYSMLDVYLMLLVILVMSVYSLKYLLIALKSFRRQMVKKNKKE